MANEQTSVPLYAASEVLTAANMNISAGTGVPVFATTVTRDAAFGGANEKVLAEGQLCYLSSTNVVQYYDGAAWATVGPAASGLTLISATTIGSAVSSVTVSSAFSATYDNYEIIVSGGAGSTNNVLTMVLGATATNYYNLSITGEYSGNTVTGNSGAAVSSWYGVGGHSTNVIDMKMQISNPFTAKTTTFSSRFARAFTPTDSLSAGMANGYLNNTTSYTAFTLAPGSGTLTGGTIRVYGYQNS